MMSKNKKPLERKMQDLSSFISENTDDEDNENNNSESADFEEGHAFILKHDYEKALPFLKKAGDQNHPLAFYWLAEIFSGGFLQTQEDVSEMEYWEAKMISALNWYHANAKKRNAQAAFVLAVIYGEGIGVKKDVAEGLKWTKTTLKMNPSDMHAHFYQGCLLLSQKAFKAALESLESVIKLDPKFNEARLVLSMVQIELARAKNDYEKVLKNIEQFLAIEKSSQAYSIRGTALFQLSRYVEANQSYECALTLNPDSDTSFFIHNQRCLIFNQQGLYEEAVQCLNTAMTIRSLADLHVDRAYLFKKLGKQDEAIMALQVALDLDDKNIRAKQAFEELIRNKNSTFSKKESHLYLLLAKTGIFKDEHKKANHEASDPYAVVVTYLADPEKESSTCTIT